MSGDRGGVSPAVNISLILIRNVIGLWQQYLNPSATDESPTDENWNAVGDFKIGGDGDLAADFSQLSSLVNKGSTASTNSRCTASGSFVRPVGNYSVLVGGVDIANKTSDTALTLQEQRQVDRPRRYEISNTLRGVAPEQNSALDPWQLSANFTAVFTTGQALVLVGVVVVCDAVGACPS